MTGIDPRGRRYDEATKRACVALHDAGWTVTEILEVHPDVSADAIRRWTREKAESVAGETLDTAFCPTQNDEAGTGKTDLGALVNRVQGMIRAELSRGDRRLKPTAIEQLVKALERTIGLQAQLDEAAGDIPAGSVAWDEAVVAFDQIGGHVLNIAVERLLIPVAES